MKVEQIYKLVNSTVSEVTGKEDLLQEDLSNIVDVGKEIINTDNVDNYVKKLVNHIGKVVFVDRLYQGSVPSVLMDKWEFGSILEKIHADMPEAQDNDSWNLQDGQSYDDDVFYQPKVSAKFFNSKDTFEIRLSFTEKQVRESFSDATQLNSFVSMLNTAVENGMTVRLDALIMRTINNMTGETLNADKDGVKAVDLLAGFNATRTEPLARENAIYDPDFIRYASYMIGLYTDRIQKISTLFNVGGQERFTPASDTHLVLLSEFAKGAKVYLESNTINNELVQLPNFESVPYWQGSGKTYNLSDSSKIDVKVSSGAKVSQDMIIGVMFDTQALGVSNLDRRTTTNYNSRGEFFTNYYKAEAGYFNDLNENFIVFYLGNQSAGSESA